MGTRWEGLGTPPRKEPQQGRDPVRETNPEATSRLGALGLIPDEMIHNRYRLMAGPVGTVGGEAEVYQCHDELRQETVALKLYYKIDRRPKDSVLALLRGLDHRHIVRIRDHFFWRERFCEVMDFCEGDTVETIAPVSGRGLRSLLEQVLDGLQYCHSQGILHRDIKPSNLLFRDAARTEVVLADFGISSVMDSLEGTYHQSSTFGRTIEYSAPELFTRENGKIEISQKTDYYALGLTLMHLLSGRSPFADSGYDEIVYAHASGDLPKPATDDAAFLTLIKGLTQHKAQNRWGFAQVQNWLKGQPILDDQRRPWRSQRPVGHGRPYPGFPQATNPQELAAHLHQFDAETALFRRNYIRDWLGNFDTDLAEAAAAIGESYTKEPKLGLFKLRYLLDTTQPLQMDGLTIHSLEELATRIAEGDEGTRPTLERLLWGGFLEAWIEAVNPVRDSADLSRAVRGIRERLKIKHRQLALFSLLYLLEPQRPLTLAPGVTIAHPRELEPALVKGPEVRRGLLKLVDEGHFEEWLNVQPQSLSRPASEALRACRQHGIDPELTILVARWCANPTVPLPFGDKQVQSPEQLATLVEASAKGRATAATLLERGWIRAWLVSTGRLPDPADLDQALSNEDWSPKAKLEVVLSLLNPALPKPRLEQDGGTLNFGSVALDETSRRTVRLTNAGGGFLHGVVTLESPDPAVTLSHTRFEGNSLELTVWVDPRHLRPGSTARNQIAIKTNGNSLVLPLAYRVGSPVATILRESFKAGLAAGGILFIYRLVVGMLFENGQESWWTLFSANDRLMLNPEVFWAPTGGYSASELGLFLLTGVILFITLAGLAAIIAFGVLKLLKPYGLERHR